MRQVAHQNHLSAELKEFVLSHAVLDQTLARVDVLDLDCLAEPLLLVATHGLRAEKLGKVQRFTSLVR